jgi:ribosomal protein S18 acetylase RimI-like enzyme
MIDIRTISSKEGSDFEEKERGIKPNIMNMRFYGIFIDDDLTGVCRINLKPKNFDGVAISYLGILEKYRGAGLASKLLDFIVNQYNNITATTGNKSNSRMREILVKYGFNQETINKNVIIWVKGKI